MMDFNTISDALGFGMPSPLVRIIFGYADEALFKLYQEILMLVFGYQEPTPLSKRVIQRVFSKSPCKTIDYDRAFNLLEQAVEETKETDTEIHEIFKVLLGRLHFVRGNLQCDTPSGRRALYYWHQSTHPFRYYYLLVYYNAKQDVALTSRYGELTYTYLMEHLKNQEYSWLPQPLQSYHEAWCQFMLGVVLRDGFYKSDKDPIKAMNFFLLAAQKHHSQAQVHVAYGLFHGIGIARKRNNACLWFERSAEQGDSEAQRNLGTCYQGGTGVMKNLTQAKKYFQMACSKGEALAYVSLGDLYFRGSGVDVDYKKAKTLYQQASEKGEATGFHNLAVLYERGLAGEQNVDKAVELYCIAASLGAEESKRAILRLKGSI